MDAYEQALNATARPWAPWYAIPADDKRFMRYQVADIVVRTLEDHDRVALLHPANGCLDPVVGHGVSRPSAGGAIGGRGRLPGVPRAVNRLYEWSTGGRAA